MQPLTRILNLKENIEVNLNALVSRYLVPRYVCILIGQTRHRRSSGNNRCLCTRAYSII
ncbi:MAG: hypothetical protein Q8N79_03860 [Candidatus Methanoperedens sp.]|nr:hypothetical protein [Candidatus Methanoperedens sp.]